MSDRTIAGCMMLAVTMLPAWLAWTALRDGEYVGKYGITVTRTDRPFAFWFLIVFHVAIGTLTLGLATLAFLPLQTAHALFAEGVQ